MAERSILYIEDNPENRLLVRRTLEASGYRVKEAVDGPSGLKAAIESYPDVILLDISLPAMDGYDLARRFSEYAHLEDVPVLAVTANVMKGDKERAIGAGCDGYIPKPINIDKLPKEIEEALKRFGRGDGREDAGGPPPADQEETKGDAERGTSQAGSMESDPSRLFDVDVDERGVQSPEGGRSGLGPSGEERVSPGNLADEAGDMEAVSERASHRDHEPPGPVDDAIEKAVGAERDGAAEDTHSEAHAEFRADRGAEDDEGAADRAEEWAAADSLGASAGDAGSAGRPEAMAREETSSGAEPSVDHPEADQVDDEAVQPDDDVMDDADGVDQRRSVVDVEELPSGASGADMEAGIDETARGDARAVAASDQGLSEDEQLLREVFGMPPAGIDAVAETGGRSGNGADRGFTGDEDEADSWGEKPLAPDDGRLGRVEAQGHTVPAEETQGLSDETVASKHGEGEGVESPDGDPIDANGAAEQGTAPGGDGSRGAEEGSPDAPSAGDERVSDAEDREGTGEADADARRVEDEAEDGQSSVSLAQPEASGDPEERQPDGSEPYPPLEREAAVTDAMNGLADELGAEAVVLMEGPHVLVSVGRMRAEGKQQLAEILAEGFETSDRVASLLGCESGCREQIVDIGDFLIHAMAVNGDLVISTAIRSNVPLGAARLWVKRSVARIESLVGEREKT